MRVLFLGSSPAAETRLRLDREYREIDAHLRENRSGGVSIELVGSWAVRIPDLSRELLRHQPDVVHFSGHGAPDGLLFDTDTDSGRLAPIGPLADLFGLVSKAHPMMMVVLNACYAHAQAEAIAAHIPVVVGTTSSITDDGAIAFASGLYRGLAFNLAPVDAIELGRTEVSLRDLPDAAIIVTSQKQQHPG